MYHHRDNWGACESEVNESEVDVVVYDEWDEVESPLDQILVVQGRVQILAHGHNHVPILDHAPCPKNALDHDRLQTESLPVLHCHDEKLQVGQYGQGGNPNPE